MKIRVQPTQTQTPKPQHKECISRLQYTILDLWNYYQNGHKSEYSVERLLAFRDYYHRTSVARAVTVCILSPIPAVFVTLAIDCIPLRPPSEGWQANYAVWIKLILAIFAESLGVVFQVRSAIVSGTISIVGAVKNALATSISSVLATIFIAEMWKFPIPFGYVLMITLYVSFFVVYMVFEIGLRQLTQSPVLRQQFQSELLVMTGIQQTVCVLVMPMIKFLAKQSIVRAAGSFHEYVGPILFFFCYYIAICTQAFKSMATMLIIMAIDNFHVLMALRSIFHRAAGDQKPSVSLSAIQCGHYLQDLSEQLEKIIQGLGPARNRKGRAGENGEFCKRFNRCSTSHDFSPQVGTAISPQPVPATATFARQHQIAPITHAQALRPVSWVSGSKVDSSWVTNAKDGTSPDTTEEDVHNALQKLFHAEYVLLAEYVEFMVPLLYALYLAVLFHLPVAAYYPHTATMTSEKLEHSVTSILIYAGVEFISFDVLFVLLKRKFGFSPLFQLALFWKLRRQLFKATFSCGPSRSCTLRWSITERFIN